MQGRKSEDDQSEGVGMAGVDVGRLWQKYWPIVGAFALLMAVAFAAVYRLRGERGSSLTKGQRNRGEANMSAALSPFAIALRQVEEDRGQPTGNKADLKVPAELKLYQDKRRFLAIQVAEWRRQHYEIPHDFSELAAMIERGEVERLKPLGDDYILYGVGLKADDRLTHYDRQTHKSFPLFSDEAQLKQEIERLGHSLEEAEARVKELTKTAAAARHDSPASRREITKQLAGAKKSATDLRTDRDSLAAFYQSAEHRRLMLEEYGKLGELAQNFGGRSYDLNDPTARKEFKVALLSALRPQALAMLEEIARLYKEKFQRPLPVTSLVRTIEYQRWLGEAGNPNAVAIDVPPHTTGLAFDIYTYYMAADEQQFLLDEIARLEREGRVEALRENRFHIHVFAFAGTGPPDERLIKESLDLKGPAEDEP